MTPERWRRVEAVFNEVVDLPDHERAAHLVSACGSDDALRGEIEALLASVPDAARSMRTAIGEVAASLPRVPRLQIGARLGKRYQIIELLGEGGMGAVYRAHDDKLGEAVALKVVRGPVDEQLLRDEVRLAQRVTHPNVCRTFDLEEVDGLHLVKMEYVPGETLATRLARDRALPIAECVRIARGVAAGLAAAHARHIVHGDLKPANIMLDGDRVLLMDFGVAWVARVAAAPVGRLRGTVGYLAPELVRDRQADERADLYALGCVLYEMLAGEPVFPAASTTDVHTRHVAIAAPSVRKMRPDTPRWLASALGDLLAKRPEDRAHGLQRVVAGPPRRMSTAVLAALVAVGAIVHNWWPSTTPTPPAEHVNGHAGSGDNVDTLMFSPDGEWLLFRSNRLGAGQPRLYHVVGR
ncbi:MAG: serine/threonine protein kinase [Deltaproteobacteria bacterium]|nr:serine/threonine protein kinase [Deltaproteobacteria bacterium]